MNIKPFYQQVVAAIKETQDNNTLRSSDAYGLFLLTLVHESTETNAGSIDAGEVNTEELAANLHYAIHEFGKALAAIDKFNQ